MSDVSVDAKPHQVVHPCVFCCQQRCQARTTANSDEEQMLTPLLTPRRTAMFFRGFEKDIIPRCNFSEYMFNYAYTTAAAHRREINWCIRRALT